jgi:hypothetical protein
MREDRSSWSSLCAAACVTTIAATAVVSAAPIELIGVGSLPGDASDGFTGLVPATLEDGTPHDRLGGFGSGITYTGIGNRYIAAPDRGPADGTTSYLDRYYVFDIAVAPGAPPAVVPTLSSATLLTNESGENFTGNAGAFDATNSPASLRLDPESVRVEAFGRFFLSDEYGPFVYEFAANGDRVRSIPIPAKFLIDHPNATGALELPPGNLQGRQANRGMEGLAITPDGSKLYGMMQSPLIQDGALDASSNRIGVNNRLLEIDLASGATRELVYVMDSKGNGSNEIVAVNDHQFLVIERDGKGGSSAVVKKIFLIDISGATDVSDVAALPTSGLPANVVPVSKTLFIDLLSPAFGLAGAGFPEKIEGLAFGPDLPDGRHLLIVTNDNDFVAANPNNFYAFAIDPSALPGGFQRQTLTEAIDIKPGESPNSINPSSKGVVPVAILSAGLFDASAVDPASVRLAGATPRKRGDGKPACDLEDVNGDGRDDLVCYVKTQRLELRADDTTATLTAETFSGTPVSGTDSVDVVGR